MGWVVWAALAAGGGMVALAWLLPRIAPEGYEDDDGFHYGRDPRTERLALDAAELEREIWIETGVYRADGQ